MTVEARADELQAAAESVLNTDVRVVGRLDFGNVNGVYKVEAAGRAFVVKVFRHEDWPEPGKLPWVESSLARRGVPRARLVHYTREPTHFPGGFSLSEFVEGENCKRAVRRGALAPAEYFRLAAALLKQVHAVTLARYGHVGDGAGTFEEFADWLLGCEVKENLRRVDDGTHPFETLFPFIERKVGAVLRRYESRFRPALVHGDCNPKNGVLTADGGLVLVDWDESVGGLWAWDYAGLTYWYSYMRGGGGSVDEGLERARASFLRAYGETGFAADELREVERAAHVTMAAGEMSYLYKVGDAPGYARSRALLLSLLEAL